MKTSLATATATLFILPLVLLSAGNVSAEDTSNLVRVSSGLISLGEFTELSPDDRRAYTTGYMDGLLGSALLSADTDALSRLQECIEGMDNRQMTAIFLKYANENPARWDNGCTMEGFFALMEVCKQRGFDILPERLQTD